MPRLSIIVPTYNESENLPEFLALLCRTLDMAARGDYEVIVVDDDSPDRTWELAEKIAADNPSIRVIRRTGARGLATAVLAGFRAAHGEVLGTINADLQHPPEALWAMYREIERADLVIASRYTEGGGLGDWSFARRFASRAAHSLGRILVPPVFGRTSDPLSGCYMFRREVIEQVELNPLGYKTLMEIMVRGKAQSVSECAYQMRARQRGKSKATPRQWLMYLWHLLRLSKASNHLPARSLAALFIVIGLVRIAATYPIMAQATDETPNIACGMQWLDLGRYDCGPFHPPLARAFIALGPYLDGLRSRGVADRWQEGNAILNSAPDYWEALTLARIGILPFFIAASIFVFLWSRRLFGDFGAISAVLIFTNLPPVLGHSGLATTDMAVTACVTGALYAFLRWIDEPGFRRSLILGIAVALAFLSKFSAMLFAGGCLILIAAWEWRRIRKDRLKMLAVSALAAFFLIWTAYHFSFGRITAPISREAADHGGLWAKIPVPWLQALERIPIPAPEIIDGLWAVGSHNLVGHPAFLLGQNRTKGWWYFFPVAVAVKTPVAILLLWLAGLFDRRTRLPAACGFLMLLVCIPAHLNTGLRYLLPMFPLLAIAGGAGAERRPRVVAGGLFLWLCLSSWLAHPDYLAYFNELAGRHPERILVDSDLDWGQDMKRLSWKLKEMGAQHVWLACQYSGNYDKLGLPAWDGLDAYVPASGWVAVSFTAVQTRGWVIAQEMGKTENPFGWLKAYRPVALVGKSILLYYIPQQPGAFSPQRNLPHPITPDIPANVLKIRESGFGT